MPSVLLCDAAGLGWLDVSSVSEDLVANTRMDLPLWLAQSLSEKNVRDPPTTSGCGCCTPTATLCTFRRTLYGSCFMHSVLPTCGLSSPASLALPIAVLLCVCDTLLDTGCGVHLPHCVAPCLCVFCSLCGAGCVPHPRWCLWTCRAPLGARCGNSCWQSLHAAGGLVRFEHDGCTSSPANSNQRRSCATTSSSGAAKLETRGGSGPCAA